MTDNLSFTFIHSWHDCECCGSYVDVELEIYRNGEFVTSFVKDGHFGNGDDVENIEAMLPKIFEALGMYASVRSVTEPD